MVPYLEQYKEALCRLLTKVRILRFDQCALYLRRRFAESRMTESYSKKSIHDAAMQGSVLISPNNYVMTPDTWEMKQAESGNYEAYDFSGSRSIRIPDYFPTDDEQKYIDCFWVILDMMPASDGFVTCDLMPWAFMFTLPDRKNCPSSLIQICRFKEGEEPVMNMLLNQTNKLMIDDKPYVKRIAVLDNDAGQLFVPAQGFIWLVTLDDTRASHFHVAKTRKDEAEIWSELRN